MNKDTIRWAAVALVSGALASAARAGEPGVRLVETRMGPPLPSGISVVQVRMTPSKTAEIPRLVFQCTLRQEFPWRGSDGREVVRVIEPAVFTHREYNVRLTHDLDRHISFRAPIREEDLVLAYGSRTFRPSIPVTVSKLRIEAQDAQGRRLWVVEVPMGRTATFP